MPSAPESMFAELKRYVRFTEADARLLVGFGKSASGEFPRIAREFYDRIREHEDAHAVLTGEEQVARLQRSLVRWIGRACGGTYDQAYFEEHAKIGRVHVKIGLAPRYMIAAMALVRIELTRLAQTFGKDTEATKEAINRVCDLELAIMLETYQEAMTERIRNANHLQVETRGRALARLEHLYANAVELAPVLVLGLDLGGNVRLFNREAERVTGYARDEILGQSFITTLLPEDLREAQRAFIASTIEGGPQQAVESELLTRAGKSRHVVWHMAHVEATTEDDVVVFVMGSDVTDAKAMAERTRQAEKLAAVGTLAAGLAHEIRNPLNGAQLHVAFLERAIVKKSGDEAMLEAVRVVNDEIKRLANLVTEFLDFARPRPLDVSATSLFALCERARALVSANAEKANVTLVCDMPSADITFLADGARLEQVLLNLVGNAIEALEPSGGGRVVVRGRRQPRAVVIEVEDDGPGIPQAAPIYDAFFSTKEGGTGLGLAITHRIVTDHKGTIDVNSRPGRTTFRVTLPLTQTDGADS
jgi:PAS domain S-box-containing protein